MAVVSTSPEYDEASAATRRSSCGRRPSRAALPLLHPRHRPGRLPSAQGEPGMDEAGQHQVGRRGKGFFPESQCSSTIHNLNIIGRLLSAWWTPKPARCWPTSTSTTWSVSAPCRPVGRLQQHPDGGKRLDRFRALGRVPPSAPPPAGPGLGQACRLVDVLHRHMPQDSFNQGLFADGRTVAEICDASTPPSRRHGRKPWMRPSSYLARE